MTPFASLVLDIVSGLAPPPVRIRLASLALDDEAVRQSAARDLGRLGFHPSARVLRAMLTSVPRATANVFRDAIIRIDPALARVPVSRKEVDPESLAWILKHHQMRVSLKGVKFLSQHAKRGDLPLIEELIDHPNKMIGLVALDVASRISPGRFRSELLKRLDAAADSGDSDLQLDAAEIIRRHKSTDFFPVLRKLASSDKGAVRRAALEAWIELYPPTAETLANEFLLDGHWEVRALAAKLAADHGGPDVVDKLILLAGDNEGEVRKAAFDSITKRAPDRLPEFALKMMGHNNENAGELAISILTSMEPPFDPVQFAIDHLPDADHRGGVRLMGMIVDKSPEREGDAARAALRSKDGDLRADAAGRIARSGSPEDIAVLRRLRLDADADVRSTALDGLLHALPDEVTDLAVESSHDPNWRVRLAATEAMASVTDPLLIEELVARSRDEDEDVRESAIKALAQYDDQRVFSELVSSLNDVNDDVRNVAAEILKGKSGRVPILDRLAIEWSDDEPWIRVREDVERINRWASRVGRELLGRPVRVHQYRQGIGRTPIRKKDQPVDIEVSDTPVTTGHPHGEEIMKAIALHEIGHHLADVRERGASSTRGIAKSEGVDEIYEILIDERLERVLRSRRPEWGVYFDRLTSYAFAQNERKVLLEDYARLLGKGEQQVMDAVKTGRMPGRVVEAAGTGGKPVIALRDSDWLSVTGLVPPLMGFLSCLRCGFDPDMHPDPDVAKAVHMVPRDLKDLSHAKVLALARRISKLIGRSEDHKRRMQRLRKKLRQHRRALASLERLLNRMEAGGNLPDWMRADAPGIRSDPKPTESHETVRVTRRSRRRGRGGQGLNLGKDLDFDQLTDEEKLLYDPALHGAIVAQIRRHIRRLRGYLQRLGLRTVDEYASRRGRRLDISRTRLAAFVPSTNVLVHSHDEVMTDAYLGVVIDRSGSMDGTTSAGGTRMELARSFGVLVAESARGLPGLEGHISAFDDTTFYRLGDFERNTVASLKSGGGNNDAGGLSRAADLALRSGRRNKLLIMISDGSPTECTFESLRNLVFRLTREHKFVCVQVAVASIHHVAFPHYVDLSAESMDTGVAKFGRLLMRLTRSWR